MQGPNGYLLVLILLGLAILIAAKLKQLDRPTTDNPIRNQRSVYEKRKMYVKSMCQKYSKRINEKYKEVWPSISTEEISGKANVLINQQENFIWCRVPKAASQSWTSIFIKRWWVFSYRLSSLKKKKN